MIGNDKNHVLSDEVIKEILIYIRKKSSNKEPFTNQDVIDKLIDNPHGLTDHQTYKNFVTFVFYQTMVDALSSTYSSEDGQPMVFNMLWWEIDNKNSILHRLDSYKSWIDKYIWNEIEHPLNSNTLNNTIYDQIEQLRRGKNISIKFHPFKVADHIYFNGLNP